MSFILSDTGKKITVALKYYPWLLFCLSCSDFSILAVTAFPKSLCFVSKHGQLLHKICIALVAFFWLFNGSSLKLGAQNFSEAAWENCAFSMQCETEKKQEGSMRFFFFFLFPLFAFPQEGSLITDIPALCFPQSCCFVVSAWMQDLVPCVTCVTWSVGEAGLEWGVIQKWVLWGWWTNSSVWCELGSAGFWACCLFEAGFSCSSWPLCWPTSPCFVSPAPAMPCGMPPSGSSCSCPGELGHSCGTAHPQLPFHASELLLWLQLPEEVPWSPLFSPVLSPELSWLHLTEHVAVSWLYTKCVSLVLFHRT